MLILGKEENPVHAGFHRHERLVSMPTSNDSSNVNEALPTVIEYVCQSGVLIHITPLSLFAVQAIINKSESIFEYPPEKDYRLYEMEVNGILTRAEDVSASGFFPATENLEYVALCKDIDAKRLEWQNDALIELACAYPQYTNRLDMIAAFRPQLEALRPYVDMHEDEWQNVLEFCVFTGVLDLVDSGGKRLRTTERHKIIQYARQNSTLALTTSEVVGSLRVFRV